MMIYQAAYRPVCQDHKLTVGRQCRKSLFVTLCNAGKFFYYQLFTDKNCTEKVLYVVRLDVTFLRIYTDATKKGEGRNLPLFARRVVVSLPGDAGKPEFPEGHQTSKTF